MKYERLTIKRENGFATVRNTTLQGLIDRLVELEDKIESGELVDRNSYLDYFMAKDISGMTDKEIEFFAKHNARVRENADAEIARLTAENAELRERLDKAVELPFENLDKVFILAGEDTKTKQFIPDRIVEGTIVGFGYDIYEWVDGNYKFNYHVLVGENNYIFALEQFNKTLFKTREAAEARLKELKGE